MSYQIKEVFYSLQGEGVHTGRPAIFCRFSQCNLWSGREQDRQDAICQFCDTDFIGTDGQNGGRFNSADALSQHLFLFGQRLLAKPRLSYLPVASLYYRLTRLLLKACTNMAFISL